jgi:hypothetical protein
MSFLDPHREVAATCVRLAPEKQGGRYDAGEVAAELACRDICEGSRGTSTAVTVMSGKEVIRDLRKHVFNDRVRPAGAPRRSTRLPAVLALKNPTLPLSPPAGVDAMGSKGIR